MLRNLLRLLPEPERRDLVVLTAWLTAAAILHGIALGLTGLLVAAVLDPDEKAAPVAVSLGVATLGFVMTQWIAQTIAFRVGSESARALHVELGEQVARLPLGWFTPARQAQVIADATAGVPTLMSYPALLLRPALTAVITPLAAALTLTLLDWRYPLAALAAIVISWFVSRFSARRAAQVDVRRHQVTTEATSRLLEYATRQHLIRTDAGGSQTGDLERVLGETRGAGRRSAATVIPGLLLFGVTLNTLFAVLIALGVAWVDGGSLSTPAFIGAVIVLVRLVALAASGAELAAGLRLQQGALERLTETLTSPPLPILESPHRRTDALVEADGVSFGYGNSAVLEAVDFTLPRQGLTALVGPSGAGKTTLVRLLARFWDPTAGSLTLDGDDLRGLPPEQLYARLATVLQDDHLLDTTIGENIRAGRPDASSAELAQAVEAAGLTGTIAELPQGLDTPAGPGGSKLSGGQRQRVCIARALLKAAPLTLMDEATSALDPQNRRLVVETAHRLAQTGSVVLVAHDLETIRRAEQILVLERGRVVQRGTHEELAGAEGLYRQLLQRQ